MSNTLISSINSVFTDEIISKFSRLLNEPKNNVEKTIQAAIPIVLTEILHQAGTSDGAAKIGNLAKQAAANDLFGQLHELAVSSGSLVSGSVLLRKGADFAGSLLAGKKEAVIKETSRYSGASIPSASFIVGIASFASLDAIGRQMAAGPALDAKQFAGWLDTQRESIKTVIPPGLDVKEPLGIRHFPRERAIRARQTRTLTLALGVIILLLAAAFFIFRPSNRVDVVRSATPADTVTTVPVKQTVLRDTVHAETYHITLPNGKVLDAYKGGTEDQLVAFLGDPNAKLHKKNGDWFDFTTIGFASNSGSLLLTSETQLKNIAAILAAFPKAKIKIGGYSDNTGDSTDNVRLSQQRADNILAKLKDLDVRPAQLTGAKGYGPNFPVGDNGTAEGRNMNRRMSLDVKAK